MDNKKTSFEETIGKNIMGILASVLIFAGLTMFATAVSDYIADEVKMLVIMLVSFSMFIVGLVGKSKKRNAFFMSLAGCGIGAVFISIFLAYGYFHMIGMLVLYGVLAVWAIAVAFLGGEDSVLFRIIGQIGIIVSLIFGVTQLSHSVPAERMVWSSVLVVFFIIISVVYLVIDHKERKLSYQVELFTDLIATIFLYVAAGGVESTGACAALCAVICAVICAYSLILVAVYMRHFVDIYTGHKWIVCSVLSLIINLSAATFMYYGRSGRPVVFNLIALASVIIIVVLNEIVDILDNEKNVVKLMSYIAAIYLCGKLGILSNYIGVGILVVPLVCAAFVLKDKLYYMLSLITTLLFTLFMAGKLFSNDNFVLYIILGVIFIAFNVFVFIARKKDLYSVYVKFIAYAIVQIFLLVIVNDIGYKLDVDDVIVSNIAFYISAFLCFVCSLTSFCDSWDGEIKEEKPVRSFMYIVNCVLAIWAVIEINVAESAMMHFINAIFFAAILGLNVKYAYDKYGNTAKCCIYNCFKLTVFVFCTLVSYDAAGYIVSAGLIVVSIACIVFGFIKKYKYIRLYGLILSIISIVKIVFVDLEYDSSVARAITIFICGIIAFAICLVYNILDKRLDPADDMTAQDERKREADAYAKKIGDGYSQIAIGRNPYEATRQNNKTVVAGDVIANNIEIEKLKVETDKEAKEEIKVKTKAETSREIQKEVIGTVTGQADKAAPLYYVQYVIPGPDGKPMAQLVPVYKGQAMRPVDLLGNQPNK